MGETLHGPAVIAAMIRAAYEEGEGHRLAHPDHLGSGWDSSEAKQRAARIMANAADPTLAERLLGLFREWANCGPVGSDYATAYERACKLMSQMRELVGVPPFDANTRRPREEGDGGNR